MFDVPNVSVMRSLRKEAVSIKNLARSKLVRLSARNLRRNNYVVPTIMKLASLYFLIIPVLIKFERIDFETTASYWILIFRFFVNQCEAIGAMSSPPQ